MGTTQEDIKGWLAEGKKEKATHVVIVCDTFDYEDYPVYVKKGQDIHKVVDAYHGKNMARVMEVYNLAKPIEPQLAENRSWNY